MDNIKRFCFLLFLFPIGLLSQNNSEPEFNDQQKQFFQLVEKYGNFSCCDSLSEKQCNIFRDKVHQFMDSTLILENWRGELKKLIIENAPDTAFLAFAEIDIKGVLGMDKVEYNSEKENYVFLIGNISPSGLADINFNFRILYQKDELNEMLRDIGEEPFEAGKNSVIYFTNEDGGNDLGTLYFNGIIKSDYSNSYYECEKWEGADNYHPYTFDFRLLNIGKKH